MQIDDRVEAMVRRILSAVVKTDDAEFYAALHAPPDDHTRAEALKLAATICAYTMLDAFDGRPTPADLALMVEHVVAMVHWVPLERVEVNAFLAAILDGTSFIGALDTVPAVMLTFIVTASLLVTSPKVRKDECWHNYLDRIEATIQAT